jgi:hypothetical protein
MKLADIIDSSNVEPRPPRTLEGYRNISRWIEEELWGHRLWSRQTSWLLFLEFLNVADFFNEQGLMFAALQGGRLPTYRLRDRAYLRNILFNNSSLERIAARKVDDNAKWAEWSSYMKDGAEHIPEPDFAYVRKRFTKFRDFATVVDLLRDTAIVPKAETKRWLSRFLFPFGPSSLYRDLDAKGAADANNFGRTGELLYLMLTRSDRAAELAERFKLILSTGLPGDKVVQMLLPGTSDSERVADGRVGGFLPYKRHPAYDRLARDWIAILDLKLPPHDATAHLVPLASLHVLIYQLETASVWLGKEQPYFICEVIAPRMERIRELAGRSFLYNDGLPRMAIHRALDIFTESPEWQQLIERVEGAPDSEKVREASELLESRFWVKPTPQDTLNIADLLSNLHNDLDDKADNSSAAVHLEFGKQCGLVSLRGTRKYRYAPTDSLLKTIVLANVRRRMELNEFLALLFENYRLVFGPTEAGKALSDEYEETPFQANKNRLEERLRSMGMLNRLSDGLAYVENPAL